MVGGGGAMMMCLFLVMVKTEEDMVFLQRVSTTGSDHKLVENLRRKLLTNNNDYELQEAREASDRALEAALDNVDDRTPEDTLHNDGDRAPEAKMLNVRHRALGITRSRFGTRAPETTSNKTGTRKPTSTSDTVPDSVSNNSYGVTKSVLQDSEIADVKNALNMALRLTRRKATTPAPPPAPTQRRLYHIYRYPGRRMYGNVGVTFTVKRFKFRQI